jgi:hypothetical protein
VEVAHHATHPSTAGSGAGSTSVPELEKVSSWGLDLREDILV